MTVLGLTPTDEQKITAVLAEFGEVRQALVFGSRAMGNCKQGSDVDIALKGQLDVSSVTRIKARLEELPLPYFFDLVDYDRITEPALRAHIDEFGKVFYAR